MSAHRGDGVRSGFGTTFSLGGGLHREVTHVRTAGSLRRAAGLGVAKAAPPLGAGLAAAWPRPPRNRSASVGGATRTGWSNALILPPGPSPPVT